MSNPTPSPYTLGAVIENDQGKFTLIREQGQPNEAGAFDVELWEKEGIDRRRQVFLRSLTGDRFTAANP
jgi:hypothetical protein